MVHKPPVYHRGFCATITKNKKELYVLETAQERLEREWLQIRDTRRTRGFDLRSQERKERDFVPNTYVSSAPVDPEPEEPVETPNTFTSNFKGTF